MVLDIIWQKKENVLKGIHLIGRMSGKYLSGICKIGIWGLLITLIFIFTPTPIATIFFHEPSAIATAVSYLVIIGFSEAFLCIELTTIGAISGLGKTNLCSIISILSGLRGVGCFFCRYFSDSCFIIKRTFVLRALDAAKFLFCFQ